MLHRLANLEQNLLQTNNLLLTTLDHQQVTDQQLQDLQTSQQQLQQQVANVQGVLQGFLIIDDEVYHFGASIKDLGKRWFGVNLITEHTADELISRL